MRVGDAVQKSLIQWRIKIKAVIFPAFPPQWHRKAAVDGMVDVAVDPAVLAALRRKRKIGRRSGFALKNYGVLVVGDGHMRKNELAAEAGQKAGQQGVKTVVFHETAEIELSSERDGEIEPGLILFAKPAGVILGGDTDRLPLRVALRLRIHDGCEKNQQCKAGRYDDDEMPRQLGLERTVPHHGLRPDQVSIIMSSAGCSVMAEEDGLSARKIRAVSCSWTLENFPSVL